MRITCIAAITLDGKIAKHQRHFTDWTSMEDKRVLTEKLDASDAVIVGRNTFDIAREPLSKRNCVVFTRSVDSQKRMSDQLLFCNPAEIDVRALLENYSAIAVLGGTPVYSWFLERGLVDTLLLTIEPIVFGYGLPLFDLGDQVPDIHWRLTECTQLNERGSLLLQYDVTRSSSV